MPALGRSAKKMNNELTTEIANDLERQFEAGLAKVKYEFNKNLNEADPLDTDSLEKTLSVFNQRLVIFQHEFLEYIARVRGGVASHTEEFKVEPPPKSRIPEIASSIVAGGGSAILVALIPVGTSGWWIWASTVTVAAAIGSAVGAPVGLVTAGVGVLVGAAAGVGAAICLKKYRRKLVREKLVEKFDKEISPKLRNWAHGKIHSDQNL